MDEQYSQSLEILRKRFISENAELLKKIQKSKKTGTISFDNFDDAFLQRYLEVFEISNFYFPDLLQLYEELLYLYNFSEYDERSLCIKDYCKDVLDTKSFMKEAESIAEVIAARNHLKKHVKQLAKQIGIKKLDLSSHSGDFCSLEQYVRAIEKGKKKTLHHSGDVEFLVSKIPLNGKGFVESKLGIDNRIFYTFKSEQIIEMARVSKPGIYFIANIPYDEYVKAAYYILFVTEGDAYLVDNNIHSLRSFLSRSDERLMERRTTDTFLPWEIIYNFLEKKSEDKSLTNKTDFSFRVIGHLTDVNNTDIIGMTAFLDTCLYTFTKTDFLKNITPALRVGMLDAKFLAQPENKALVLYKNNIPTIASMNLDWNPEKFGLPKGNSGSYLMPYLKKAVVDVSSLKSDELSSTAQVEKKLMYSLRQQSADDLKKKLEKDYEKNWKNVQNKIDKFVKEKFASNKQHFITKILEDREYSYKRYKTFGDCGFGYRNAKFKGDFIVEKRKILSVISKKKRVSGRRTEFYSGSNTHFHLVDWTGWRNKWYPCAGCGKNGRTEYVLSIEDVQQFISFFELTEKEIKSLPKQMLFYLNQSRTLYDGNSILDDLDPVANIHNPWWGRDPLITMSIALCEFCKRKGNKNG